MSVSIGDLQSSIRLEYQAYVSGMREAAQAARDFQASEQAATQGHQAFQQTLNQTSQTVKQSALAFTESVKGVDDLGRSVQTTTQHYQDQTATVRQTITGYDAYQQQVKITASAHGDLNTAMQSAASTAQAQAVGLNAAKESSDGLRGSVTSLAAEYYLLRQALNVTEQAIQTLLAPITAWESQLQQIQANTVLTNEGIAQMSQTIMDLGKTTSAPLADLAGGYMRLTNEGFNAAQSTKILTAAQELAVGTGANVAQVTNILGVAMHDYKIPADQAAATTNTLLAAVREGNTTMSEFAGPLQRLLPLASNLGISFSDLASMIAALTREGVPATMVGSQLQNMMVRLAEPTAAQTKELQKLTQESGVNLVGAWSAQNIAAGHVNEALAATHQALTITGEDVTRLYPNLRGLTAGIALTGKGWEDYAAINRIVTQTTSDAIAVHEAYIASLDTMAGKLGVARNATTEFGIAIGSLALPEAKKTVDDYTGALEHMMNIAADVKLVSTLLSDEKLTEADRWRVTFDIVTKNEDGLRKLGEQYGLLPSAAETALSSVSGLGTGMDTADNSARGLSAGVRGLADDAKALAAAHVPLLQQALLTVNSQLKINKGSVEEFGRAHQLASEQVGMLSGALNILAGAMNTVAKVQKPVDTHADTQATRDATLATQEDTKATIANMEGKGRLAGLMTQLAAAYRTGTVAQQEALKGQIEIEKAQEGIDTKAATSATTAANKAAAEATRLANEAKAIRERESADIATAAEMTSKSKLQEAAGYLEANRLEQAGDAEGAKAAIEAGKVKQAALDASLAAYKTWEAGVKTQLAAVNADERLAAEATIAGKGREVDAYQMAADAERAGAHQSALDIIAAGKEAQKAEDDIGKAITAADKQETALRKQIRADDVKDFIDKENLKISKAIDSERQQIALLSLRAQAEANTSAGTAAAGAQDLQTYRTTEAGKLAVMQIGMDAEKDRTKQYIDGLNIQREQQIAAVTQQEMVNQASIKAQEEAVKVGLAREEQAIRESMILRIAALKGPLAEQESLALAATEDMKRIANDEEMLIVNLKIAETNMVVANDQLQLIAAQDLQDALVALAGGTVDAQAAADRKTTAAALVGYRDQLLGYITLVEGQLKADGQLSAADQERLVAAKTQAGVLTGQIADITTKGNDAIGLSAGNAAVKLAGLGAASTVMASTFNGNLASINSHFDQLIAKASALSGATGGGASGTSNAAGFGSGAGGGLFGGSFSGDTRTAGQTAVQAAQTQVTLATAVVSQQDIQLEQLKQEKNQLDQNNAAAEARVKAEAAIVTQLGLQLQTMNDEAAANPANQLLSTQGKQLAVQRDQLVIQGASTVEIDKQIAAVRNQETLAKDQLTLSEDGIVKAQQDAKLRQDRAQGEIVINTALDSRIALLTLETQILQQQLKIEQDMVSIAKGNAAGGGLQSGLTSGASGGSTGGTFTIDGQTFSSMADYVARYSQLFPNSPYATHGTGGGNGIVGTPSASYYPAQGGPSVPSPTPAGSVGGTAGTTNVTSNITVNVTVDGKTVTSHVLSGIADGAVVNVPLQQGQLA